MPFSFKKSDTKLTLTLAGDIDLEITPDLKQQLIGELEDATALDIDGRNVTYIDSSGVSILVIAMQNCNKAGLELTISTVSDQLMRVLQLAHLDNLLPIGEQTGMAEVTQEDVFPSAGMKDSDIAFSLDETSNEAEEDKAIVADLAGLAEQSPPKNTEEETNIAEPALSEESKEPEEPAENAEENTDTPAANTGASPFKPGTF